MVTLAPAKRTSTSLPVQRVSLSSSLDGAPSCSVRWATRSALLPSTMVALKVLDELVVSEVEPRLGATSRPQIRPVASVALHPADRFTSQIQDTPGQWQP